ncbi:MAG: hypothetical protein IT306_03490 [Chloroflexi bacterium]|nr:hypothetical protein [Chloroflexota bacterium]
MTEYVPELLNELTRTVITTRNANPSSAAYDDVVLPAWRACEELRAVIKQDQQGVPTLEQMRFIYRNVLLMLATKMAPPDEIRRRLDEVFARCERGVYPVDRAAIEADPGDNAVVATLSSSANPAAR